MVACFLIGIIWLVTYYASNGDAPIPAIHAWNLLIGFGFGIAGFILVHPLALTALVHPAPHAVRPHFSPHGTTIRCVRACRAG